MTSSALTTDLAERRVIAIVAAPLLVLLATALVYTLFWLDVRDARMMAVVPVVRAAGAIATIAAVIGGVAYAWGRVLTPRTSSLLTTIGVIVVLGLAQDRLPVAEFVMGEFAADVGDANDLVLWPIAAIAGLALVSVGVFRPLSDADAEASLDALLAANPPIEVDDGLPLGTRVLIYDPDCAACTELVERTSVAAGKPALLVASVHSDFARGVAARHPAVAGATGPIVVDRDDLFGECVATGWNARVSLDIVALGRPSRLSRELAMLLPMAVLDAACRICAGHAHRTVNGLAPAVTRARRTGRELA